MPNKKKKKNKEQLAQQREVDVAFATYLSFCFVAVYEALYLSFVP